MLEQWLYQRLMKSKLFHHFVKTVHAYVNNLPPPRLQHEIHEQLFDYKPTVGHKFNAFRVIFVDEMKKSFWLKK